MIRKVLTAAGIPTIPAHPDQLTVPEALAAVEPAPSLATPPAVPAPDLPAPLSAPTTAPVTPMPEDVPLALRLPAIQAALLYFATYAPWTIAFAALLPVTVRPVDIGDWWGPYLLAWLACFLGTSVAMYSQALIGFGQPGRRPVAMIGAFLFAATLFATTAWWMREADLYNAPAWILVNTLALLAAASAAGYAIAREIQQSGHLIAVALVGVTVDMWSVFQGPSKQIASSVIDAVERGVYTGEVAPPWISFLLMRFPVPGVPEIQAMMGVGDVVFLAFFFGCVVRFGLPPTLNFVGLTLGVVGSMLLVNILHALYEIPAIPALPIIAPLFILLNAGRLRMDAREWRVTLVFVGLLLMAILAMTAMRLLPAAA